MIHCDNIPLFIAMFFKNLYQENNNYTFTDFQNILYYITRKTYALSKCLPRTATETTIINLKLITNSQDLKPAATNYKFAGFYTTLELPI